MINIRHSQLILINELLTELKVEFPVNLKYNQYNLCITRKPLVGELNTELLNWIHNELGTGTFADGLIVVTQL